MKVFLIGATGYIGSVVAEALLAAGHEVTGLSRSMESDDTLRSCGVNPVRADLKNPATLTVPADGIIFAGSTNDGPVDMNAMRALLTGKPFIYTSGIWILGDTHGQVFDESSPVNPVALVAWRPEAERMALAGGGVVIRPALVYGRAAGLLTMMVQSAKETGAARYVGDGETRWPLVHVEDLAELYVLALEKAKPRSMYMAADGPSYKVREIAEAASYGADAAGATQAVPVEEARKQYGALVDALVLDQQISGEKATRELGWKPHGASVLEELRYGSYAQPRNNP
jgi:nucleoside-diphosphate-sugar epimerase